MPSEEAQYGQVWVQATIPAIATDPSLIVGSIWVDTTTPALKRCTSISPVTFASTEGGSSAHDLLSATHTDTLAASVVRGDVMIGNSTPAWSRLAVGSNNQVLTSDGTDVSWQDAGAASAESMARKFLIMGG